MRSDRTTTTASFTPFTIHARTRNASPETTFAGASISSFNVSARTGAGGGASRTGGTRANRLGFLARVYSKGMTVALSTWTLDPIVKARYPDAPGAEPQGRLALGPEDGIEAWEIPAAAKERGFEALEYPHFHLPHDESGRQAVVTRAAEAGIPLGTLLIDDGDAAHPENGPRDEAWIARWLVVAGEMGFARARFIPGRAHHDIGTFARGLEAVKRLADVAEEAGVRPLIENWFGLMDSPDRVLQVLDALGGRVGLCADFGNWAPPLRDELPMILPRAETIHAKAEFDAEGSLDKTLLKHQVGQALAAGFDGPYVVVAGGPNDVWTGAQTTAEQIRTDAFPARLLPQTGGRERSFPRPAGEGAPKGADGGG